LKSFKFVGFNFVIHRTHELTTLATRDLFQTSRFVICVSWETAVDSRLRSLRAISSCLHSL